MFQAVTLEARKHMICVFLQVTTGTTAGTSLLRAWTCLTLGIVFVMLGALCRSTDLLLALGVQVSL